MDVGRRLLFCLLRRVEPLARGFGITTSEWFGHRAAADVPAFSPVKLAQLLRDTLSVSARAIQPNLGAVGAHFGLSAALLAFFALLACAVVAASTTVQANPRAGPNPPGSGPGCVHDPMGGRHAAPSPAGSPAAAAAAPGAGQSAAAGLMGGGPTDGGVVPCCWLVIHWPNPQFLALAVVAAYWCGGASPRQRRQLMKPSSFLVGRRRVSWLAARILKYAPKFCPCEGCGASRRRCGTSQSRGCCRSGTASQPRRASPTQ